MKRIFNFFTIALAALAFAGCDSSENTTNTGDTPVTPPVPSNITYQPTGVPDFNVDNYAEWAGCRSSVYGMDKFPTVTKWTQYVGKMASFYKKNANEYSQGTFIWLVGTVTNSKTKSCWLSFPQPKGVTIPDGIEFNDVDENEEYLTAFDEAGYNVWLQVESGFVDIEKLATVVMTKYKHHKCVKGFGIDVEWYQNITDGKPGTKLDDETASKVDAAVKKVNSDYSVFVKHWRKDYLPKTYRGVNNDMIFVTDSQGFSSLDRMQSYYSGWANDYAPNPVFFQIGYDGDKEDDDDPNEIGSDEAIWRTFDKPLQGLGQAILDSCENSDQKIGIIWVDFTFEKAYRLSK